jgi:DNA-binding response OmpR family regulator
MTMAPSPKELVARVKAVLRRGGVENEQEPSERITVGQVVIDSGRHEVSVEGKPVVFTATEFRLIHFLANHPGRVFTRDQLIGRIIGDGAIVIDRNIDVHVRAVRKKLGEQRDLIETVRGVGYRFRDVD